MKKMAQSITEENISEFREAFEIFDKNRDGFIDFHELLEVMSCLGQKFSEQDFENLKSKFDLNQDSLFDFGEFIDVFVTLSRKETSEEKLMDAFKHYDRDGNGSITAEELKQVLLETGYSIDERRVEEIIKEMDYDGDGNIDYEEFVTMISNNE